MRITTLSGEALFSKCSTLPSSAPSPNYENRLDMLTGHFRDRLHQRQKALSPFLNTAEKSLKLQTASFLERYAATQTSESHIKKN